MHYKILNQDFDLPLIQRLLNIRSISDNPQEFLNPTLASYWLDPFLLDDMGKAVERIIGAIKKGEKIMIFGDYDVDGITSSYLIYKFISHFLGYKNISIRYPHRIDDGYGIKIKHIQEMQQQGVNLILTVDNGVSAIEEAVFAKTLGIDFIVTDHHQPLDQLPDAYALINPQTSPNYPFKGLAGVGVAFKLVNALLSKSTFSAEKKNQIFNYFLPIVAIGTVADVVPLVQENRVIVQRGLELINQCPKEIPQSLKRFLDYLNIKGKVDTFHIGFVIGPRINAGGRIDSPYDSLKIFLHEDNQQIKYLDKIEEINKERKKIQDQAFKLAEKELELDHYFLSLAHPDFHEGIVGIVAGRITEKYYKPAGIFKIDTDKQQAIASLRGPEYFNVIKMIEQASHLLQRFGGHKGAGGLTVDLSHLDEVLKIFQDYCKKNIDPQQLIKIPTIDTEIFPHEWNPQDLQAIELLAPFGEGNTEPQLLFKQVKVERVERVGKNGGAHLKIYGKFGNQSVNFIFRGDGEASATITSELSIIGKIKKDSFNGGYFVDGNSWF